MDEGKAQQQIFEQNPQELPAQFAQLTFHHITQKEKLSKRRLFILGEET